MSSLSGLKRSLKSDWVPDEAAFGRDHDMLLPITIDGLAPPLGLPNSFRLSISRIGAVISRTIVCKKYSSGSGNCCVNLTGTRPRSTVADELKAQTRAMDIEAIRDQFAAVRNRQIFLIIGSFNEEWQISLNYHLMRAAQRVGLACSVLVPSEDHSVGEQTALLKSALADGTDYAGRYPDMLRLARSLGDKTSSRPQRRLPIPLVLVDRNPPAGLSPHPFGKLSYVSVSDAEGRQASPQMPCCSLAQHVSLSKEFSSSQATPNTARHKSFQKQDSEEPSTLRDA